ncbi:uncharacterized protein A1O9_01205 [Exophiala aquamarina CBS 119918]|uniref:Major facilitator superfamily (MFS) profile domain-containing protein n=1 Tax=Exophiala aquamarina CBS 119918 TaxID=1182545 RepID=A0A072PV66_9EURO|nr:uncharacterized protein A1O9_01205 [Exophiala aquamarina CBS 119918]KEF63228.1 hypothetical protein A1O9_01205 [Exophiala aquamarina CBS 119918]
MEEKVPSAEGQVEVLKPSELNLTYDDIDEEPSLHVRTYIALAAMFMLNLAQMVALQGPPTFLNSIGADLKAPQTQVWIVTVLPIVQAALGPIVSSASDLFQARKALLVCCCTISFIGSAIAPRATSVYQVIAAQTLIGFGFATVPLAYCVPSEIVPNKWRPMTQAVMNIAACLGAMVAPVILGSFLQVDRTRGWRNFYWVQMGMWAITALGIFAGYRPPKRHTRLDHLSGLQKIQKMDLYGCGLLILGLCVFLAGLNLGGGLYSWINARVLATVIIGGMILVAFFLYEWRGTKTGILHHEIFNGADGTGRTAAISMFLIAVEAIMATPYYLFYPVQTAALFDTEPMKIVARQEAFWIGCIIGSVIFGFWSTKYKTIREPMAGGFLIFTGGQVGFSTIQPGQSVNAIAFCTISGFGFGVVLVLVVAGVQLCTPHHLIATSTAVVTTTRGMAGAIAIAMYSAVFRTRIEQRLPAYVGEAALSSGLSPDSVPAFVGAFLTNDTALLTNTTGVTPKMLAASVVAMKQAYADSLRMVFIMAVPFGVAAIIACYFLASINKMMHYGVDAPVELLHAKNYQVNDSQAV